MPKPKILNIEAPDIEGVLSFLNENVTVAAVIHEGSVLINVKATHPGEDDEWESTWDEHDFEVKLPTKD
jgi:hypothetical protein